jgi:stage II sporulation protein D
MACILEALLLTAACGPPLVPDAPGVPPVTLPAEIAVRTAGRVAGVPLDDYVLATVLAEVSPSGDSAPVAARIFEVQAIVGRSYATAHLGRHQAEGFDLCDTTHCQVYDPGRVKSSRLTPIAREAVKQTAGRILIYGGRPAEGLFHADCGGSTAAADAVWGGRHVPYLLPRPDDLGPSVHRRWKWSAPADALRKALSGDARTNVGARLTGVEVTSRDDSGRARQITLDGDTRKVVRGEDFRMAISRALGARTIQSTRLSITRSGSTYAFEGSGFGHGVGLCQVGAAARARRGETTEQILAAYFTGATIR